MINKIDHFILTKISISSIIIVFMPSDECIIGKLYSIPRGKTFDSRPKAEIKSRDPRLRA